MAGNATNFVQPDFMRALNTTELSVDNASKVMQRFADTSGNLLATGWQGESGALAFRNASTMVGEAAQAAIQKMGTGYAGLAGANQKYSTTEQSMPEVVTGHIRSLLNF